MSLRLTILLWLLYITAAFAVLLPPRQAANLPRSIIPGGSTNRVDVLCSSVLVAGVRTNFWRSMAVTNAQRIVDVNLTNAAPATPTLGITVAFKTPWLVRVRKSLDGAPVTQIFDATVSFADSNQGTRFYQVERPAFSQSVTLTWDASPSENVAGYHIYVGTNSGSYFSQRTVSGLSTTVHVDAIEEGRTYYFAASAFDGTGQESELSNEVSYQPPTYEVHPRIQLR